MTSFIQLDKSLEGNALLWEKPATNLQAYLWLLFHAQYYPEKGLEIGDLCVSLRYLGEAWGWSKNKVSRFLENLKIEGLITYQNVLINKERDVTWDANRDATRDVNKNYRTLISVIDYHKTDQVMRRKPGRNTGHNTGQKENNKNKKKKEKNKVSSSSEIYIERNPEKLREILNGIDLSKFKDKYPDLDINTVFADFRDKVMQSNPYNYTHFESGLHTWCRKRREWNKKDKEVSNEKKNGPSDHGWPDNIQMLENEKNGYKMGHAMMLDEEEAKGNPDPAKIARIKLNLQRLLDNVNKRIEKERER